MQSPTIKTEAKILNRKIFLKGQAIKLFKQERRAMKRRLFLLDEKARLENLIKGPHFDLSLSRKLEAVLVLLEE
jgi:hypothetical protein